MSISAGVSSRWTVADLFSCGGGTSAGFSRKPEFEIVAALDLEIAKPSGGVGASNCNATYEANHGLRPLRENIVTFPPDRFRNESLLGDRSLTVLISCAPCTDFSRAKPNNHLIDSQQNDLVGRSADYVEDLKPDILFMENARELVSGRFNHHFLTLRSRLKALGYDVRAEVHKWTAFGLPQIRERALIVASRVSEARTLTDLWSGWQVRPEATTVRSAFSRLNQWLEENPHDLTGSVFPATGAVVQKRLQATPHDGGSWADLARDPKTFHYLTRDCRRRWEEGRAGSHPDVYGRMWWDRPAPTIKRECSHVGNGRYAHPEEDRLLTVREMASLQGFPFDYLFPARSVANRYRHVGDAVPPLIAWQMSCLARWMKTGVRPRKEDLIMPLTTLQAEDISSLN